MFLITTPHGRCTQLLKRSHWCDIEANTAARALLESLRGIFHPGDSYRAMVDLNRLEARETVYRAELREFLSDASFLLDVHSFPETDPEWGEADLAILVPPGAPLELAQEIAAHMEYSILVIVAGWENDIVVEALEHGVSGLLFEFNEGRDVEKVARELGYTLKGLSIPQRAHTAR